jgi:predicted nuclease of predicted toxin-antitoxin system
MAVVRMLRLKGHDVARVSDRGSGMTDASVARIAQQEQRALLTEDKDFGQLVRALSGAKVGVMLLRFRQGARSGIGDASANAVEALGDRLQSAFVVVEPGRFRVTEPKP